MDESSVATTENFSATANFSKVAIPSGMESWRQPLVLLNTNILAVAKESICPGIVDADTGFVDSGADESQPENPIERRKKERQ